ncbi:FHA domain-containing protein [Vibrio lamellibrachiae]|uniref:type VI secretion system-associated FHA domain protein n=1 Tax=Vibrio lamellibrachiae TaxID=2910253 RepID=UPI003D09A354
MNTNQLILFITKCPEEYTGSKHIEMPETGGSIGRNPGCTVPLSDLNRFISGTHCLISVYGESFYISDVSTNGTLINGEKSLKNQPVSLFDGDTITLGQYEISASFEKAESTADIAMDIAPERNSIDPLSSLGDVAIQEDRKTGALEDLFIETKVDDVDSDDPVAHLKFTMQNEDDALIRVQNENSLIPELMKNQRQMVDDGLSVQSEFDAPSLIPADWMAGESTNESNNTEIVENNQESFLAQEQSPHDPARPSQIESYVKPEEAVHHSTQDCESQAKQKESIDVQEQKIPHWEEVTRSFEPAVSGSKSNLKPEQTNAQLKPQVSPERTLNQSECDKSHAFLQGLGLSSIEIGQVDTELFTQMGQCLRLCINKLQSDLHEVENLKGDFQSSTSETDFAMLMFTLSQQKLLTPQELVEQMLDELEEHKSTFDLAINNAFSHQMKIQNPQSFASEMEKNSRFITKGKLWNAYNDFYDDSCRDLHSDATKNKIKQSYQDILKGEHA